MENMLEISKTKIATANQCIKFTSKTNSLTQKPSLGTKDMN